MSGYAINNQSISIHLSQALSLYMAQSLFFLKKKNDVLKIIVLFLYPHREASALTNKLPQE
jgi:hypothetical protein